ncbi:hypothetical protein DFH09DRAFT_1368877 [Mycena vulgaris]|nr:hypothetical protein DFH09DRAFT_1368877 [Mycena vulgaris]
MPPDREASATQKANDTLRQALGLHDKPGIYDPLRGTIHQYVDQSLDICLPAYQQQANMQRFVGNIVDSFPGYFNDAHTNKKERIMALQAYAGSYLEEKRVELNPDDNKIAKKGRSKASTPFPSPPKGDAVKVQRPRPRPTFRSKKKPTVVKERTADALLDALPIDTDTDAVSATQDAPKHSDAEDTDSSVFLKHGRRSFVVPSPTPSPSPEPTRPKDPIVVFLENCCPPMEHLTTALQCAGATSEEHLLGMTHWNEALLRNFLKTASVVRTALEEEALIVGFGCLQSEHISRSVDAHA